MEIGAMLSDSLEYTKEGLMDKWVKWILLIISVIIFPLILGYMLKVLKGTTPAPEIDDWVGMFIDGIKVIIVEFIYMIPVMIVMFLVAGGSVLGMASQDPGVAMAAMGAAGLGFLVAAVLALIISLIAVIGLVRLARTDSIGEAFNFSAILDTIGQIGWVTYIIALIVLYIVLAVISFILGLIPVIGWLLIFILYPAFYIFGSRYISLLYDSAGTA
ncbi:MAG: hypothetical protein APR53_07190 [Methanoculleus sp. SDB]|nr:MAG: hypothetical protein APR53_07190 [Methanoculleus sp. SDB]